MRIVSIFKNQYLIGALFALAFTLALSMPASAQETGNNAVKLSPLILEFQVDPGEVIETEIRIENISEAILSVETDVNDFIASDDESGSPQILLDDTEESAFSIKDFITLPNGVKIDPKSSKDIPVTITIPEDASPGGHFGIVRFTTSPDGDGQNVALSASAGTLILVDVSGDRVERLGIEEFGATQDGSFGSFFQSEPVQISVRAKNAGNVQIKPIGTISITPTFGGEKQTFEFNETRANILPNSVRRFDIDPGELGYGRYSATVSASYGDGGDILVSETTFWILPYGFIIGGGVAMIALIAFVVLGLHRYRSHILSGVSRNE